MSRVVCALAVLTVLVMPAFGGAARCHPDPFACHAELFACHPEHIRFAQCELREGSGRVDPSLHSVPLRMTVGENLDTNSVVAAPRSDSGISTGRLALVGGALFGSMAAIHIYQQNGWWRDNRAPFHFQEDLEYGLSVDKVGHFFGSYLFGFCLQKSLEWSNVPEPGALWIGSAGALLFQTYVEVEDGFSAWGFDRVDFASDVGGAAWPIARYYIPSLGNFDLKMSYHPSDLLGNPGGIGFKGQKHLMIDDYEGQTVWMSVKVHNLLPAPARPYWPDFLCLALGYGARDVADPRPYRVWFLALDLDMTALVPARTGFLKTLGEALNFIHMPLPAVRFSPGAIWYGIYF